MMASPVNLWKEWGIQAMVLLSFTLQVTLLILAELRRRVDYGILRFFTWSAYQMADSVAIFVLGHLAVTSRSPEHKLVVLWAPFLLVHLGGQDNITAYAMEDNELWLRHLQTLAVQAAAAAYVLYSSSIFSGNHHSLLLQMAAILMFVVGVVKYGERVWTLRYATGSKQGRNRSRLRSNEEYVLGRSRLSDTEDIIFLSHVMLDVPKAILKGSQVYRIKFRGRLHLEEAYKLAEVQVSLMHDVLYTKAESQRGVIRLVSLLATAVALFLLLLLLLGRDRHKNTEGYNNVDVAITCVLSVGAVVLESMSLLRHILSSFTWHRYEWVNRKRGLRAQVVTSLRRLIHASDLRIRFSWSRSIGQHNLLQVCSWIKTSRTSKMARWLAVEDWWNMLFCSWSVPITPLIERLVVKWVQESRDISEESPDHILNSRGRAAIKRKSQKLYDDLNLSVDPDCLSLEQSILVWHIATDLYLRWYKEQRASCSGGRDDVAKAVEALSNYMLFLLAARPNMMPPSASRLDYTQMRHFLNLIEYTSAEDLAGLLRCHGDALNNPGAAEFEFPCNNLIDQIVIKADLTLKRGSQLAAKLIGEESQDSLSPDMLELIGNVWVEILCYVGTRCNGYSHAKQLSDGGELITVAAFLIEYLKRGILEGSSSITIDSAV